VGGVAPVTPVLSFDSSYLNLSYKPCDNSPYGFQHTILNHNKVPCGSPCLGHVAPYNLPIKCHVSLNNSPTCFPLSTCHVNTFQLINDMSPATCGSIPYHVILYGLYSQQSVPCHISLYRLYRLYSQQNFACLEK
jgi:hypothetical protein